MIFYYAAGGGLGHLTRARAVIHTLGLEKPIALLTTSPFADDPRIFGSRQPNLEVIKIPQAFEANLHDYRSWLKALFTERRPTELFLDAFPAGLLGEFADFEFPESIKIYHLARLLRWDEYRKQLSGAAPKFDTTYLLEPLAQPHQEFLQQQSNAFNNLTLADPPHDLTDELKDLAVRIMRPTVAEYTLINRQQAIHKPIWLIVHAGSSTELAELIAYADEMQRLEQLTPRLIVLSPEPLETIRAALTTMCQTADSDLQSSDPKTSTLDAELVTRHASLVTAFELFDFYPATAFYRLADRLITACGFNVMRQTEAYQTKHRFLPFARRFDDQYQRAILRNRLTVLPK